jgi:hypothetical protein
MSRHGHTRSELGIAGEKLRCLVSNAQLTVEVLSQPNRKARRVPATAIRRGLYVAST